MNKKLCLVLSLVFVCTILCSCLAAESPAYAETEDYGDRLFDTSEVHSIDIIMDDWEDFIKNCTDEEYVCCDLVIDGEEYTDIAIRAKGNTSLSTVTTATVSK